MAQSKIISLPDEVLQSILLHLDAATTIALEQTCRRFGDVANEPLLWKQFCRSSFRHWDAQHELKAKARDPSFLDWKQLYGKRRAASGLSAGLMHDVLRESVGRLDLIQSIVELGYDAKDTLLGLYRDSPTSPYHLAQKYWSHTALGCLHRSLALSTWTAFRFRAEEEDATEKVLAALDLFILETREDGDVDDIFDRLRSYAASIRAEQPEIDDLPPREKASVIASHLLEKGWTGIRGGRHYHSIDHMFLGVSLFSENRNSLPLLSAVIYCFVARQFGLRAAPCSYPFHVHAVVRSPPGLDLDGNPLGDPNEPDTDPDTSEGPDPATTMFMDPFHSSEAIQSSTLLNQLRFIAPTSNPAQTASYLAPATARDLLIRSAHNILSAPSQYSGPPLFPINKESATYAALFCLISLPAAPLQLRQQLHALTQQFLEHFDHDIHLFHNHVLPLTANLADHDAYKNLISEFRRADLEPKVPKRRSAPENSVVKFRIGQVFRHRRRGYLAVIYGWDYRCKMAEQWISMNQVDRLPLGRHQPFYNVIVDDKSTRYVAQENVVLLLPEEMQAADIDGLPMEVGKWFKRFDHEQAVFVSNVEDEYPEG